MKFSKREVDGVVVLDLKGKLQGGPEAEQFRDLFKALVDEGKTNVIINLKEVEWIASTGIGIMMRGYKTIKEANGQFVLAHVGERTQQIFNVLRLPDIFEILDTEQEALEKIARSGGETPPFADGATRAAAVARAIKKSTGATYGIAVHGTEEGDQRTENLGKGETYIAVSGPNGERTRHVRSAGRGGPDRQRAAMGALSLFRRELLGLPE